MEESEEKQFQERVSKIFEGYKQIACIDCSDEFKDENNHRRSTDMPFLCETCAEYRQGGY